MVSTRVLETVEQALGELAAPPTGIPFSFSTNLSIAFNATSGGTTRLLFAATCGDAGVWAMKGGFCRKEVRIRVRVLGDCLDCGGKGFGVWGGYCCGFAGRRKRESLQAYPRRLRQRGDLGFGCTHIEGRHMTMADLSRLKS